MDFERMVDDPAPIRACADEEFAPPFELVESGPPRCPLVFSSPHSGDVYPARFLAQTRLDALTLRRSEDAHVDALFAGAGEAGAPLLRARFPRAYLDLNREPYELDPRMFEGPLPEFVNTRSLRVAAGLGTIPRVVADAREIYKGRLAVDEAIARVEALYKPYHATLRALMERARRRFGLGVLIDCHSMPSAHVRDGAARGEGRRVDFVVGDRFGASCAPSLVDLVEDRLRGFGYSVRRNRPYAGGFITEHYGRPALGFHAVQIEISRGLYMNETTLAHGARFDALAAHLTELVRDLAREALAGDFAQRPRQDAAE
jgi:N-formylglutamate amidohydrolase